MILCPSVECVQNTGAIIRKNGSYYDIPRGISQISMKIVIKQQQHRHEVAAHKKNVSIRQFNKLSVCLTRF